jgi:hypothetical protein
LKDGKMARKAVKFTKKDKSPTGGLSAAGRAKAKRAGYNLKAPVTGKVKKGSKAANRRKSFCARMGGMKKKLTSAKTKNDPNSRINKALRKWKC